MLPALQLAYFGDGDGEDEETKRAIAASLNSSDNLPPLPRPAEPIIANQAMKVRSSMGPSTSVTKFISDDRLLFGIGPAPDYAPLLLTDLLLFPIDEASKLDVKDSLLQPIKGYQDIPGGDLKLLLMAKRTHAPLGQMVITELTQHEPQDKKGWKSFPFSPASTLHYKTEMWSPEIASRCIVSICFSRMPPMSGTRLNEKQTFVDNVGNGFDRVPGLGQIHIYYRTVKQHEELFCKSAPSFEIGRYCDVLDEFRNGNGRSIKRWRTGQIRAKEMDPKKGIIWACGAFGWSSPGMDIRFDNDEASKRLAPLYEKSLLYWTGQPQNATGSNCYHIWHYRTMGSPSSFSATENPLSQKTLGTILAWLNSNIQDFTMPIHMLQNDSTMEDIQSFNRNACIALVAEMKSWLQDQWLPAVIGTIDTSQHKIIPNAAWRIFMNLFGRSMTFPKPFAPFFMRTPESVVTQLLPILSRHINTVLANLPIPHPTARPMDWILCILLIVVELMANKDKHKEVEIDPTTKILLTKCLADPAALRPLWLVMQEHTLRLYHESDKFWSEELFEYLNPVLKNLSKVLAIPSPSEVPMLECEFFATFMRSTRLTVQEAAFDRLAKIWQTVLPTHKEELCRWLTTHPGLIAMLTKEDPHERLWCKFINLLCDQSKHSTVSLSPTLLWRFMAILTTNDSKEMWKLFARMRQEGIPVPEEAYDQLTKGLLVQNPNSLLRLLSPLFVHAKEEKDEKKKPASIPESILLKWMITAQEQLSKPTCSEKAAWLQFMQAITSFCPQISSDVSTKAMWNSLFDNDSVLAPANSLEFVYLSLKSGKCNAAELPVKDFCNRALALTTMATLNESSTKTTDINAIEMWMKILVWIYAANPINGPLDGLLWPIFCRAKNIEWAKAWDRETGLSRQRLLQKPTVLMAEGSADGWSWWKERLLASYGFRSRASFDSIPPSSIAEFIFDLLTIVKSQELTVQVEEKVVSFLCQTICEISLLDPSGAHDFICMLASVWQQIQAIKSGPQMLRCTRIFLDQIFDMGEEKRKVSRIITATSELALSISFVLQYMIVESPILWQFLWSPNLDLAKGAFLMLLRLPLSNTESSSIPNATEWVSLRGELMFDQMWQKYRLLETKDSLSPSYLFSIALVAHHACKHGENLSKELYTHIGSTIRKGTHSWWLAYSCDRTRERSFSSEILLALISIFELIRDLPKIDIYDVEKEEKEAWMVALCGAVLDIPISQGDLPNLETRLYALLLPLLPWPWCGKVALTGLLHEHALLRATANEFLDAKAGRKTLLCLSLSCRELMKPFHSMQTKSSEGMIIYAKIVQEFAQQSFSVWERILSELFEMLSKNNNLNKKHQENDVQERLQLTLFANLLSMRFATLDGVNPNPQLVPPLRLDQREMENVVGYIIFRLRSESTTPIIRSLFYAILTGLMQWMKSPATLEALNYWNFIPLDHTILGTIKKTMIAPVPRKFPTKLGFGELEDPARTSRFHHHLEEVVGEHIGLRNLGATCYINSTLQQLAFNPIFCTWLSAVDVTKNVKQEEGKARDNTGVGGIDQKDLSKHTIHRSSGELQEQLIAWKHLYSNIKNKAAGRSGSIDPEDFIRCNRVNGRPINPRLQQDTEEYARSILTDLQVLIKRTGSEDEKKSLSRMVGMRGCTESKGACGHVRRKISDDDEIALISVGISQHSSLEAALQDDCKEKVLADLIYCESCGLDPQSSKGEYKKVKTSQRYHYTQLPDTVFFYLKRFEYDVRGMRKYDGACAFPMTLNMSPYIQSSSDIKELTNMYELKGVTAHIGTYEGGHYYAYCYDEGSTKWFEMNDRSCTNAEEMKNKQFSPLFGGEERRQPNAVILQYRRMGTNAVNSDMKRQERLPTQKEQEQKEQYPTVFGEQQLHHLQWLKDIAMQSPKQLPQKSWELLISYEICRGECYRMDYELLETARAHWKQTSMNFWTDQVFSHSQLKTRFDVVAFHASWSSSCRTFYYSLMASFEEMLHQPEKDHKLIPNKEVMTLVLAPFAGTHYFMLWSEPIMIRHLQWIQYVHHLYGQHANIGERIFSEKGMETCISMRAKPSSEQEGRSDFWKLTWFPFEEHEAMQKGFMGISDRYPAALYPRLWNGLFGLLSATSPKPLDDAKRMDITICYFLAMMGDVHALWSSQVTKWNEDQVRSIKKFGGLPVFPDHAKAKWIEIERQMGHFVTLTWSSSLASQESKAEAVVKRVIMRTWQEHSSFAVFALRVFVCSVIKCSPTLEERQKWFFAYISGILTHIESILKHSRMKKKTSNQDDDSDSPAIAWNTMDVLIDEMSRFVTDSNIRAACGFTVVLPSPTNKAAAQPWSLKSIAEICKLSSQSSLAALIKWVETYGVGSGQIPLHRSNSHLGNMIWKQNKPEPCVFYDSELETDLIGSDIRIYQGDMIKNLHNFLQVTSHLSKASTPVEFSALIVPADSLRHGTNHTSQEARLAQAIIETRKRLSQAN